VSVALNGPLFESRKVGSIDARQGLHFDASDPSVTIFDDDIDLCAVLVAMLRKGSELIRSARVLGIQRLIRFNASLLVST